MGRIVRALLSIVLLLVVLSVGSVAVFRWINPPYSAFMAGLKRAMKTTYYQDGEKQLVLEATEVELYNRFEDQLFARPK